MQIGFFNKTARQKNMIYAFPEIEALNDHWIISPIIQLPYLPQPYLKGYSHLFPWGLAGSFAPNDGGLWDTDDGAVHGHSTTNSHHLVVRFDVKSWLNWKIKHRTHFMHLEKKGLLVKQRNIIIMYGHMNNAFYI